MSFLLPLSWQSSFIPPLRMSHSHPSRYSPTVYLLARNQLLNVSESRHNLLAHIVQLIGSTVPKYGQLPDASVPFPLSVHQVLPGMMVPAIGLLNIAERGVYVPSDSAYYLLGASLFANSTSTGSSFVLGASGSSSPSVRIPASTASFFRTLTISSERLWTLPRLL